MPQSKTISVYRDEAGHEPFTDWLQKLRDQQGRKRIQARILRLEHGNYGDYRAVGEGVLELRLFFGPGYHVYFGEQGGNLVILLCGGDKDSQPKDIALAKAYWKEYLNHA